MTLSMEFVVVVFNCYLHASRWQIINLDLLLLLVYYYNMS